MQQPAYALGLRVGVSATQALTAMRTAQREKIDGQVTEAYQKYADAIFRHCFFRVYDRERAKELMQETFLKTWRHMRDKGEIENIRAFLYTVAQNLIIDQARKKKEQSLESLVEKGFQPSQITHQQVEIQIDAEVVMERCRTIAPQYQHVIVLRFVDQLSVQEIAEVTGETVNAVSVRLYRAIRAIRRAVA